MATRLSPLSRAYSPLSLLTGLEIDPDTAESSEDRQARGIEFPHSLRSGERVAKFSLADSRVIAEAEGIRART